MKKFFICFSFIPNLLIRANTFCLLSTVKYLEYIDSCDTFWWPISAILIFMCVSRTFTFNTWCSIHFHHEYVNHFSQVHLRPIQYTYVDVQGWLDAKRSTFVQVRNVVEIKSKVMTCEFSGVSKFFFRFNFIEPT